MTAPGLSPERMGRATLDPSGPFEAGSVQSLRLTYTAGRYGIDDSGSIRVVHRFATDMEAPQLDDPAAPGYVTAEASNGVGLEVRWDPLGHVRPWFRMLSVRVTGGFLAEGDRIVIRYGDPRGGCPGIRLQTFCEEAFAFRVLADPVATGRFVALPTSPAVRIVPGPPASWHAVLPTLRRVGEPFSLGLKAEDRWGNPSDRCDRVLRLRANLSVDGLPEVVRMEPGEASVRLYGLSVAVEGDLRIEVLAMPFEGGLRREGAGEGGAGEDEGARARSNPLRVVARAERLPYWADLHGQSGETVGTNPARAWFGFARDRAFLDAACHQGNDFQITDDVWRHLNELTRELDRDGRFVAFPGYEWSGNTGVGGDRNVLYLEEGRPIHRSSRALVGGAAGGGGGDDRDDPEPGPDATNAADAPGASGADTPDAAALFVRLRGEHCLVFAHVGGRYSDLARAHDGALERAVEIHSAWGTFEWLLHDAFALGYRVGVTANSDGHKGRPGASHPGASTFGAYGGLTCILARGLTRAEIFDALRRRHHYGTTGSRIHLDTRLRFRETVQLLDEDPAWGPAGSRPVREAIMGDLVRTDADRATLRVEVAAPAALERIEILNGPTTVGVWRPYGEAELGRRIRVIWEGAERRGRRRLTVWDGSARLEGNRFGRVEPINFFNPEKRLRRDGDAALGWAALTGGNFGGFDAWLDDPAAGLLAVDTGPIRFRVPVEEIGLDDRVWEAGGLGRRIRVFRMPDRHGVGEGGGGEGDGEGASGPEAGGAGGPPPPGAVPELPAASVVSFEREVPLRPAEDDALYVRVTTEDGHRAWSSPIYPIPGDP